MKTASLVSVALASLLAVACSAPPVENDLGDGNGTPSSSKKKNSSGDSPEGLPNTTKSDPTPTPTPTPTPAPSATPSPKPTPPPVTPVDPNANACADLGQCCVQLDSYGQLACLAVQVLGKTDTCATSLIACKASVLLGGGNQGGNDQFCQDDFDCPGDLICDNNLCH